MDIRTYLQESKIDSKKNTSGESLAALLKKCP